MTDFPAEALLVLSKKHIELPLDEPSLIDEQQFLKTLEQHFSYLLDNDFERLLQIMYRIDVPEREFALTLQPKTERTVANELAELVYKRLLLKIKIREKYK